MNVLEIIFIIVCAAFVLDGYRVGLVKTVFSAVKMIIGVFLAAVVCMSVTGVISHELRYIVPVVFVSVYGIVMGILGAVERLFNLVDKIPVAKQALRYCGRIIKIRDYGMACFLCYRILCGYIMGLGCISYV